MANPSLYLGIDLGGTNIKAAVVDEDGRVHGQAQAKTKPEIGLESVLERIASISREAVANAKEDWGDLLGAGIGAPGPVDPRKGRLLGAVNLGWGEVPLADALKRKLGMPVVADNDVRVGAWGEYSVGAGRRCDNMLAVFCGTGVGGALILEGDLQYGHTFSAGEIGHTVVQAFAPIGQRTLEELASRGAIARRLVEMVGASHPSILPKLVEGDLGKIRSKVIAAALKQNDALTCAVVDDAAKALGAAIANALTLMPVPMVVLGGGLAEALGDDLLKRVRPAFEACVFPAELQKTKIVVGKLGDDAGPIGAALLAAEKL